MQQNSTLIVKQTMNIFCLLCVCSYLESLLSWIFSNKFQNWSNISKWNKLKFFVIFAAIQMLNSVLLSQLQFCLEFLWLHQNLMFQSRDKVKFYPHIFLTLINKWLTNLFSFVFVDSWKSNIFFINNNFKYCR
jgi:hypothetical protein